MKRSTLPLPRYVLRKPIKSGGYAYYFNAPIWARKAGCPVRNEPLWMESNAWCPRLTAAMISSGSAVHVKGLGLAFVSATYRLMAV